jgi:hypothetical protein
MNKSTLTTLICTCFFFLNSCNTEIQKIDSPVYYHSQTSLKKSKELNMFLVEYEPQKVEINDSINFEIYEAWIENVYNYSDINSDGTLKKKFKPKNGTHLSFCVKGDISKKFKGLGNNWSISGVINVPPDSTTPNQYTYFSTYKEKFQYPYPDSIEIKLTYTVPSIDSNKFDEIFDLGHFYLHKKKK